MSKRPNQKLKLLYLSKIFLEKTDDTHKLTMTQILSELEKYGIYAERKSIYDDMEALRVFGINVCCSRDRYIKYYVSQNAVELVDVKIIYDLLLQSGLLTEVKINELVKKFASGNLPGEVKKLSVESGFAESTVFDAAYKNLLSICDAISNDKKIKFKYFDWNSHKQRMLLFNGDFVTVAPVSVKLENKRYLVYAFNENSGAIDAYYADRMVNVLVSGKKRNLPDDVSELIPTNSRENIRLRCDNSMAGALFDEFGINVTVLTNRESYFEVSLKAELNDGFYAWIFAQKGGVQILSPDTAQKKYRELLEVNFKRLMTDL